MDPILDGRVILLDGRYFGSGSKRRPTPGRDTRCKFLSHFKMFFSLFWKKDIFFFFFLFHPFFSFSSFLVFFVCIHVCTEMYVQFSLGAIACCSGLKNKTIQVTSRLSCWIQPASAKESLYTRRSYPD